MSTASGIDTLSAALALASDGNKVFPLDGKIPFKGTRGLKDASMMLEKLIAGCDAILAEGKEAVTV